MPKLKRKKDGFSYIGLAAALIFLINPCLRTIDLLPDFVSSIIIAKMLAPYCDRAPGFTEAKSAFTKLGWLSFLKIPAFIVMILARSQNTNDTDIITLFSFVFAVFEAYYLIIAVKKLFDALFHVGLRGADAVIVSYPILGSRIRMKPEILKALVYIFAIVKSVAYALPEMLLLATTDPFGDPQVIHRAWALYPVYLRNGFIVTLCFGIIVTYLFFCYVRAIRKAGGIRGAVSSLYGEGELLEIEEFIHAKSLKLRLRLLMISGFFTLDFVFDSTGGIDLLPNFIYGIFLFVAIGKLFDDGGAKTVAKLCSALYTLVGAFGYFLIIDFLSVYQYTSLVKKAAKDAYKPILISSAIEFFVLAVTLAALGILLYKFAKRHTSVGEDPTTRLTMSNRKKMAIKTVIYSTLGIFSGLTKFLSALFKYFRVTSSVEIKNQTQLINTGMLPWFDSFGIFVTLVFIAYGCYYFSALCDEVDLKYS